MYFFDKQWKGKNYKFYVHKDKEGLWIHYQGQTFFWTNQKDIKTKKKQTVNKKGLIVSPLPGKIQKIFVKKGDKLKKGQNLLILSAMKIEYSFKAEQEGYVKNIFCHLEQTVDLGKKLIEVEYDNLKKEI